MIVNQKTRERKLKQSIDYVKIESEKENYPCYKDLKIKFNIACYKITLADIYPTLGINLLEIPIHKSKNCQEFLRKELIKYVKKEVSNGHYPTRRFIENKFKLRLDPGLFKSIEDLYNKAGIKYKQENSQELKNKKAKILTDIVISILPKLGLDILEVKKIHNKGVDIIAIDYHKKIIGVEIKAHNKYEPIKRRNFLQLKRFLEQEKLDKVILITTTSRFENNVEKPDNLKIIDYAKLKELCNQDQLDKLHFVRNESIHQETKEKQIKRQLIINYAKEKAKQGKDISHKSISKDLHIRPFTYFDSIYDIYDQANILPPIRKIGGRRHPEPNKYYEKVLLKMLDYMKKEIAKGHYPSGIDLGKKFGIKHIWDFVTMTELYNRLGLQPYQIREKRGPRHR